MTIGEYRLIVATPGGTLATRVPGGDTVAPIAEALRAVPIPQSTPPDRVEALLQRAEAETSRVERAAEIAQALADGNELDYVISHADELVALVRRLIGERRLQEAQRLARAMATVLLLARRWLALIRLLRTLIVAVAELPSGPDGIEALRFESWARHELGTLKLVAGDKDARSELCRAMRQRESIGDPAADLTRQNLALVARGCGWRPRRRHIAAAIAMVLLLLALSAAVGAVIADSPPDDDDPVSLGGPTASDCQQSGPGWLAQDARASCRFTANPPARLVGTLQKRLRTHVEPGQADARATTGTLRVCDTENRCVPFGPKGPFKVDLAPPDVTIVAPVSGEGIAEGDSFRVEFSCSDEGSGLEQPCTAIAAGGDRLTSPSTLRATTPGAFRLTVSARDRVGWTATESVGYTVEGKTSPVAIDCDSPPTGWRSDNVAVTCRATSVTPLANPDEAVVTLITSVAPGETNANASTDERTICNADGACSTAGPFTGLKVDRQPPTLTAHLDPPADIYYQGDSLSVVIDSCTDPGGVEDPKCPLGGPLDTTNVGAYRISLTATDEAGQASAPVVLTYAVRNSVD